MRKKLFAVTLSLALCTGLLAGCMSDSSSSSSSSSSMQSSSTMMDDVESGMSKVESDIQSGMSDMMDGSSSTSHSSSSEMSTSKAAAAAAALEDSAWATRLVNEANPLPEDFSIKTVMIEGYENRPFDARAADALEEMLADAETAGCKLYLVSAYRSVERQRNLFARKTQSFVNEGFPQEEAEKQAAQWVARPGTSEHNLGLAADIVSANWYSNHDDLTADFENTPEFEWLQAHCAEYGFILRYPKGKESVTGITYEPWHYRYVGKDAAAQIMAEGITLEEYTQQNA
ncbi:D-alanyl-D-alanine carboxypeptidase family protein [uncultured Ruthenibacterium sp.]|uniref:M15 family metallopeptidase n=1 Tax=uncultured Ruthenibacterium sp. TaxID=1905347 RepID=UPI00349EDC68